jgi:dephospho-CoA kinase
MIILGLTGSIAMGKSIMAQLFQGENIPVHDADQTVHMLLASGGGATDAVSEAFPDIVSADGGIDRLRLGGVVFNDDAKRRQLEQILHPLVRADRDEWLNRQRQDGAFCVGFDVPLLFETGGDKDCDYTVVATASAYLQHCRALGRGMTEDRLNAILKLQMPDAIKRDKADFIVPSDYGKSASRWYVQRICHEIKRISNA